MTFLQSHKMTLIAAGLGVLALGCAFIPLKTTSPVDGRKVTRTELKVEYDVFAARYKAAVRDLDDKEKRLAQLATLGASVANTYAPGASDLLAGLFGLTTLGAAGDNLRMRRKAAKPKATTVEK